MKISKHIEKILSEYLNICYLYSVTNLIYHIPIYLCVFWYILDLIVNFPFMAKDWVYLSTWNNTTKRKADQTYEIKFSWHWDHVKHLTTIARVYCLEKNTRLWWITESRLKWGAGESTQVKFLERPSWLKLIQEGIDSPIFLNKMNL